MTNHVRRARKAEPVALPPPAAPLKSISPRVQALLSRAEEAAAGFDNKLFAEMYVTALRRKLLDGDDALYKFMGHLEQAPVDIETFIDDPEFLGATDISMWPEVRAAVIGINRDWWKGLAHGGKVEALLMGACVDADTEFLTPDGWKSIADYRPGDLVGQYHSDGSVTFVTPQRYVRYRAEEFLHFNPRGGVNMALTEGHRVIYKHHKTGEIQEISAEDLRDKQRTLKGGFKGKFITTFSVPGRVGIPLSDEEIRVMVMVHADGSFYERTAWCNLVVKKPRKVARAVELLEAAGIPYRRTDRPDGYTRIKFYAPERNKTYEGWMNCTEAQLRVVTDEVIFWDGNDQHRQFYTAKREEADFIQYAYAATGTRATMQWQDRGGSRSTEYRVKACKNDTISLQNSGDCITALPSPDGYCYCFTLDTGMWVMRRAGSIAITGNTGTGKSTLAMVSTLYHLHILGCLRQPQAVYGLPKTTAIVFPIMAAKPHVTKKVVYRPLRKLFEDIPWFQKHLRLDTQVESEIDIKEKNIRVVVGGADEDSILGEAVIGGIIDEINFMNVVLRSKKSEATSGRAGLYDQAKNIYEAMVGRKKGRFITKGPCIGVVVVSSSTRYSGDFTDKRKAHIEKTGEQGVYIYNKKQYEVWPQDRYSGKTFRLLVGNDTMSDTRVLEDDEVMPDGALILDVPVEYRDDFVKNPHRYLRDVIGMSTTSVHPFIRRRFTILDCIQRGEEEGLVSFLEKDNVHLGRDGMPRVKRGHYCANPSRPRYVHIDLSLNGDRCIAAGQQVLLDGGRRVSIERVRVGDAVITHDGTSKPVVAVHSNGRKQVLDVAIYGWADPLRATGNHRVWAVRRDAVSYANGRLVKPSDRKFYGRSKKAAHARYSFTPEFVELGSLRVGDFLVTPRPVQEDYTMLGDVPLSYEAGYIAGLFAAEGSFYTQHGHEAVQFSLHKNETRILAYLTMAIGKVFGAKTRVIYDSRGSGVTVRTTRCDEMTTFLYDTIGEYSHGKHMQVWRHGNRAFHAGLCHGYVDGDGYVKYDASGVPVAFHVKTVSMEMADSFYWLLTANGYTVTLHKEDGYTSIYNGEEVTHRPSAKLSVSGRAQMERFAEWGAGHDEVPSAQTISLPGYVLRPIQTICDGGEESVYDLTVADNSSYIVGTSAVHNCGIALLRFDGLRKVERDGGMIEMLPECSVEMACSIEPDGNNEIQIAEVRMWVKQLRDVFGYPIKVVTYDGVMSIESRQQWKKEGAKTGYVSVDRTSAPYKQLRDAFSDGRIKMYDQPVLVDELFGLEYDGDKDKVDHPPVNGSKDVADAVCGAYHTLIQRRSSWSDAAADDEANAASLRAEYEDRLDEPRPH